MPSPPKDNKPPNHYGWTPERRAAARERALKNKPWEKSTGPKTAAGKARTSQNACKKGELLKRAMTLRAGCELLLIHRIYMKKFKSFAINNMGLYSPDKTTDRQNELIKTLIYQELYPPPPRKNQNKLINSDTSLRRAGTPREESKE